VNRLFRWGIIIALLILISSGIVSIRLIFVEDKDVEVPSLVGLSLVEASNRLNAAGLSARPDIVDSDQPRDVVIYQSVPSGEKAAKGNTINLKVSRGGALIHIPDVRGMQFAEAVKTLDAAGLKLGSVLRVPDQIKPAGVVIAQNPASPAGVISSRMIELLVSEGKAGLSTTVQIPDLRGQEEGIARQILEQSELYVSRVAQIESKLVPPGSVVQTQPKAGTRVQSGASLTLFLAKAPAEEPKIETAAEGATAQNPAQLPPPMEVPVAGAVPPVIPIDQVDTEPPAPPATVPVIPRPPTVPVTPSLPSPPLAPAGGKTAKLRYQVPPLSRALPFKIVITDAAGTRTLQDKQANGGEYISIEAPYSGSASISIELGGEVIWQERYE
jgi:serine/threonine-protein kinase